MQKRWSQFVTTSTKLVIAKAIKNSILPDEAIINKIYLIREQKVMLDKDLAEMYGIETKRLKEAVKRNAERFPKDFMFTLTQKEFQHLRSQFATSSWGGTGIYQ
jgi:ORF6N domain